MADAGFFRGTSAAQDNRFSDKEKKMMKQMKFSDSLVKKVDMPRVKLDVIKPWIARRVTEMLGAEDEVLVEFVFNQLEEKNLNPRKMQINLTGFLNGKNARVFMQELWDLLCSASTNPSGIPDSFIEEKKEEIKKRNEEKAHQEQLIGRQLEAERQRVERQLSCAVRRPPSHSPPPEERRQRRHSRSETRHPTQAAPALDGDGRRRDPASDSAGAAGTSPASDGGDRVAEGTRRHERAVMDREAVPSESDVGGSSETVVKRRSSRSNKWDVQDSDRKTASRSRRGNSQSRESRWNRPHSVDGVRSRSRSPDRPRSRSRSPDRRRSRSPSRDRRRSRSRSRERYRSRSRSRNRYKSRSQSRELQRSRSRSRSPEPRRPSEKQNRRQLTSSARSSPRSRRSLRPRSSSRERRRAEKKQSGGSSAAATARSVSPADRGQVGRPETRRPAAENGSKSSKRKRRAASDDESDVDKKKGKKKKKKKKHSKKHKKRKSRKHSRSISKDKEPGEKKDTPSHVADAAEDSENSEPPLWRDDSDVKPNDATGISENHASGARSTDDESAGSSDAGVSLELKDDESSLFAEDTVASPARHSDSHVSPKDAEDSSSSEDEQDMEALEKKLRERALRSMLRRQEMKAAMLPAPHDTRPRSSPSSQGSE